MVLRKGAQSGLPITVSAGTTSVIGHLALVSCEARRDETALVYQDTTAIDSVPYGQGLLSAIRMGDHEAPIDWDEQRFPRSLSGYTGE